MGGGYYEREVESAPISYSDKSAKLLSEVITIHKSLEPKRCVEAPLESTHKHPIVFALDVTGSMGDWAKIVYDKFPMFYGQIMIQGYLTDPSVSFCGIGDVQYDNAPLQVTDFGEGKQIDQLISKVYLEGGGGGNLVESYDLAAYFYLQHCKLSNAEIPFFFLTADEGFYQKLLPHQVVKVGLPAPKEIDAKQLFGDLKKKFNVFLLRKPYDDDQNVDAYANKAIEKKWKALLGEANVLDIKTPKACIDVILGAIAIATGTRKLENYIEDMKLRGQEKDRIGEVREALTNMAKMFKKEDLVRFEK